MAARLLLGLLVVGFAAASVLTNVPAPASPCAAPCNCAQANMDPQFVWNNLVTEGGAGGFGDSPPTTTVAVGPDRVFISNAFTFKLLNKTTNQVIASWFEGQFYRAPGAVSALVTYDTIHARFWATWLRIQWCQMLITFNNGPAPGVKCATQAVSMGPSNYSAFFGTVVAGVPSTGCTPLTNAAQILGNIALVQRGPCPFSVAILNAQNAGAVAVIVYDNVIEPLVFMAPGPNAANISVPAIFMNLTDGTVLATSGPINVTMTSNFNTFFSSQLIIAVSQSSSPNSQADFFVNPYTNPQWNTSLVNAPRHATTSDTLYLSASVFSEQFANQSAVYTGPSLVALPKIALMGGAAPTETWRVTLPPTQSPVVVAGVRTPLLSSNPPAWFVGLGPTTATPTCRTEVSQLAFYQGTAGAAPSSTPYLLPMPTPVCALELNLASFFAIGPYFPMGARQPPPAVPAGLQVDGSFASAATDGNVIVFAFAHNVSSVHTIVRWGAADLGTYWSNQQLSLQQIGDVNPVPGALDGIYPVADIDVQGNIALALFTSSTSKFGGGSYTGRLRQDPLGTLRYPLQNWARSNNTYYSANVPLGDASYLDNVNHWLNYNGLGRDPNGKDFYVYTAVPNPAGPFDAQGRTQSWTTSLGKFSITNAQSCPPLYPTTPLATPVDLEFEARYAAAHPNGFINVLQASQGVAPQSYDNSGASVS
jgi:hypothetical protein